MNFDQAFDTLLGHEGAYSNHPSDPGGETMWGVTRRVAIQEGYMGDMHVFPRETAKDIYRRRYWAPMHCDEMPDALRYTLFDAAVNSGVKQATVWLQRAMDVGDDGLFGPLTLEAAKRATNPLDALRIAVRFNAERLDFMTSLPTWGSFSRGWARRIASNLKGIA